MDKQEKQAFVQQLRLLDSRRMQVHHFEEALTLLTPEERVVLEYLVLAPRKQAVSSLAELLQMEKTNVYRRRDMALEKLRVALGVS